jgi:AcrR family transcriptional regulator
MSREATTPERIVAAAGALFHRRGLRAVSMDEIADRAGITKKTLYYHFRSKDDLITACLEARDEPNLALFRQWFEGAEGDVVARVRALFTGLGATARNPRWKGCGFLRTSVELIELPGHPALVLARAHKRRLEAWLAEALGASGIGGDTRPLARQIVLLIDGAFAVVLLHRDAGYMDSAADAAASLVAARLASG